MNSCYSARTVAIELALEDQVLAIPSFEIVTSVTETAYANS